MSDASEKKDQDLELKAPENVIARMLVVIVPRSSVRFKVHICRVFFSELRSNSTKIAIDTPSYFPQPLFFNTPTGYHGYLASLSLIPLLCPSSGRSGPRS